MNKSTTSATARDGACDGDAADSIIMREFVVAYPRRHDCVVGGMEKQRFKLTVAKWLAQALDVLASLPLGCYVTRPLQSDNSSGPCPRMPRITSCPDWSHLPEASRHAPPPPSHLFFMKATLFSKKTKKSKNTTFRSLRDGKCIALRWLTYLVISELIGRTHPKRE